jgi:hypothetical protein
MANEAILRYGNEMLAQDYTCADGTGIEKGTLLKMTDPRTVIITSAAGDVCAGIAAREKIANDGRIRIAVLREGDFDMVASGAITVGSAVISAGVPANQVKAATFGAHSGAQIIGYALETAADQEVIQVRLML